ncbi:VanZ family protein [Tepidimonas taiwanensis]|uniref:VanZ like family protein n=1 Tax=Tepidimonas taiwanensis TaxID=307486 RepID=A0A554X4S4_9BURK|nr:VanZ family protein [Tepidimonas taiwanensis]MCX7692417.1 VanZ family protein [Tepidimonas taiwanensis]MDM7463388.1 VanZ family protein [Tepidimonas taiwanensis]TSE30818.1 VanZ like family protein [Tepidimonas taiwanensis]UBQ05093.1 VanZ family protein [Tepidimonas taiwanensis]
MALARVASPGPAGRHGSLAWPLLLGYTALVVYASLFPFEGWRDQGVAPWAFLSAPWPRYWTRFDVIANLLGYVPLGLLVTVAVARSGWPRAAAVAGTVAPALLALGLEAAQTYLPQRVPSQLDALLNASGALLGAVMAHILLRQGVLGSWGAFRARWQQPGGHWAWLVLLVWPLAVLYPTPVPFGTGQFWPRLEAALLRMFEGSALQGWLPPAQVSAPPRPLGEALLVALSLALPVLLGYASVRTLGQRVAFALLFGLVAWGSGGLSAALSFGPDKAWAWLTPQAQLGLVAAAGVALLALPLPSRVAALLAVLCGGWVLGQLNRVPDPAYLGEWLQSWEQGRFSRFHGLGQWLGWLWPWAALAAAARLALRPSGGAYNRRP